MMEMVGIVMLQQWTSMSMWFCVMMMFLANKRDLRFVRASPNDSGFASSATWAPLVLDVHELETAWSHHRFLCSLEVLLRGELI